MAFLGMVFSSLPWMLTLACFAPSGSRKNNNDNNNSNSNNNSNNNDNDNDNDNEDVRLGLSPRPDGWQRSSPKSLMEGSSHAGRDWAG